VASVACGHAAGPAGIFDTDAFAAYLQAGLLKKIGYGLLLFVETKRLDGAGEVFHRKKLMIAGDDRDANGVDVGIQEVFAVTFGVHPEVVNHGGVGCFGYVFRNETEVRTGTGSADGKVGFAGKLVGDFSVSGHFAGMVASCLSENGVAMERWEALSGSSLIGGGEEVLLGYIRHRCCLLGGRTSGKRDGGDCEKHNDSKRFITNSEGRTLMPHEDCSLYLNLPLSDISAALGAILSGGAARVNSTFGAGDEGQGRQGKTAEKLL